MLGLLLAVASPGQFFPHYYQLLLPLMCILSAIGLQLLFERDCAGGRLRFPWRTCVFAVLAAVWLGVYSMQYLAMTPEQRSQVKHGEQFINDRRVGRLIGQMTDPNDTIFVWGAETGLFFYSRRSSATGITYIYPLFIGSEDNRAKHFYRLFQEVTAAVPKLVVFNRHYALPEQTPFKRFLTTRYEKNTEVGPYAIYLRKPSVS
jgi:hypothetical protein